jgi:hypothetical protein
MGAFSGIGNAQVWNQGGNYLAPDGEYLLAIRKMQVIKTRAKGLAFVVNFKVLESSLPNLVPVGSSADWFQSLQDPDIGLSSVKGFMAALLAVNLSNPPEKMEFDESLEQILEEATEYSGPEAGHPLYDHQIRCSTVMKMTKQDREFTQHRWSAA